MLLFILFIAVAIGALVIAEATTSAERQRRVSLERVRDYGPRPTAAQKAARKRGGLLSGAFGSRLAQISVRLTPGRTQESVAARLLSAGVANRISPRGFMAGKLLLGVVGVAVGALLGSLASAGTAVMFALVLGVLGFVGPEIVVGRRVRARLDSIQADLPNAIDILSIAVEAGSGFDSAVALLIDHLDGPLADEFEFTFNELRIGESRAEALRKLSERVDVPMMGSLTSAVIQGDRLGISLSRVLRSLASDTRRRRQLDAEERANKMAVRMIFPIALFIMPALFIVMLGPAVLSLTHSL